MKYLISIAVLIAALFTLPSLLKGQEEHAKEEGEHRHEAEQKTVSKSPQKVGVPHDDHHDEEKDHGNEGTESAEEHGHEHGEEGEEESGAVGPEKGILEASEELGFKLAPEAIKNFDLRTSKIEGNGPWQVPSAAVMESGEEINFYRVRSGYIKRIDFTSLKRSSSGLLVRSEDLATGDEIIIQGVGFVRIAELAAFGGVADGHSH